MQRFCLAIVLAIGVGLAIVPRAFGQVLDPHTVYEKACRSCHNEHGADMSRQKLELANGALRVARTKTAVEQLLKKHHGVKLSPAETAGLMDLFKKGITWAGVFQHRCARCHGRAAEFARARLGLVDGTVRSKASNIEVGPFLGSHGEATAAEIQTLVEMLKYQIETAPK